ncbi:MAG: D-glycero-beta-D-manno-heptose 1,7-bisphosphate 7-phosphatase [Candidatus Nealsonbacteria bacterium]
MLTKNKIKTQKEIVEVVRELKKQDKKIITCNGSFDILHAGHFQRLKEAKNQGDILIVCLNSDKSVREYKGPGRPVNKQDIRVKNLTDLDYVDYLVIFNELNPKRILGKIKPDIHCVGRDWGKDCVEREVVEKNGGKIYVAKWLKGFSTSKLVNIPSIKAVFLDRDGVININEPEYVHKIEDFKFIPGVLPALRKFSKTGYKIIIVTNQSGIGRGFFTKKDLQILHQWMLEQFEKAKVRINKVYFCPHVAEDNCSCRKPRIGMLEEAVKDFGINLNKSWIVGDSERDIQMGKEANLKTILLGKDAKDLAAAVKIILTK